LSSCISFSSAMMDAYSVPCAPATRARVGPGFGPRITATGYPSRVAPRRHFDESGNGLPGDCGRGSHGERWLLCRGRHAQNATQKNQCQKFAHTRLLQTTLDSRQSITPPVESYTGPRCSRHQLAPSARARQTPALLTDEFRAISSN
jgi:hypothetical protein